MPLTGYIVEACMKAVLAVVLFVLFTLQNYWHWTVRMPSVDTQSSPGAGALADIVGRDPPLVPATGTGAAGAAGITPGTSMRTGVLRTRLGGAGVPAGARNRNSAAITPDAPTVSRWQRLRAYLVPSTPRGIKRLFHRSGWFISFLFVLNAPDSNGGNGLYPPLFYRLVSNVIGGMRSQLFCLSFVSSISIDFRFCDLIG
jgi:hypothetical protein